MLLATLFTQNACDLFRDAPSDSLSEESIWTTPLLLDEYTLAWYRNMNSGFSVYMPTNGLLKGMSREYLPWFGDQITVSKTEWFSTAYGDILKSNLQELQRKGLILWTNYYSQIQSVNRLLENQDKIKEGEQKTRVLGEAYFFRAYYYYMLMQRYGGALLIEKNYDPIRDNKKFPRASYDEMVSFITADAEKAAALLPEKQIASNLGRAAKGAALMLKAKTYLWASSEVFQNKEKSYLGFTSDRSAAMIEKAVAAYDEVMTQGYTLLPVTGDTEDKIKESYRNIFLTKNSDESIFEVQHSDDGDFSTGYGHKLDRESVTPFEGGTTAAYTPTQNHVDEYGMREGTTFDPLNPYRNRDYRFYANVLYDGCTFRGRTMKIHYTKTNGKEVAGEDLTPYGSSTTAAVSKTGYYMGKFVNQNQKIDNDQVKASSQNYIIWRYAEVLLDYAELAFRQNKQGIALDMVNQIRRRAHMHELASVTWEDIVNERRVEMAFEETTYWDMFRWGVAYEKMRGTENPLYAMKIVREEGKDPVFTVSKLNKYPARVRDFRPYQYYLPIPWSEVRYQEIEQNPEWIEQ
ncbi:MAG: RagB/SusD family nutrient uptake outer membrane protein [Bacteroidales bacterium]